MRSKLFIFLITLLSFMQNSQGTGSTGRGKFFDRAIIVVFENTNYDVASRQPFFSLLAKTGANFLNFMAEDHPSQGNYVAMTAGTLGTVSDDKNYDLDLINIIDLLEDKGVTWKVYAEGYPGNCFLGAVSGRYARKHNPFISYLDIQSNSSRCSKIVNSAEFATDVSNNQLPEYVFYIPNLDDDGHDKGAAFADSWYSRQFKSLVLDPLFMENTVLITTFDESGKSSKNRIYTSIVGPSVNSGDVSEIVDHYSLLKLMEENWSLNSLGKMDAKSNTFPRIWK